MSCFNADFRFYCPGISYSSFIISCIETTLSRSRNLPTLALQREELFIYATLSGDFTLVCDLLSFGIEVEATEYSNYHAVTCKAFLSPLQIAAARGHSAIVQCLIQYGANINRRNKYGVTPLHLAAEQGHHECVKILLDAGAECRPISYIHNSAYNNPAPFINGTTPIHLAVVNNRSLCLEHLMRVSSNATDQYGRTVLYLASELAHEECMFIILRNAMTKKMINRPGYNSGEIPLHFAVRYGMVETVKRMLELESDVNHRNGTGLAPLHFCLSSNYSSNSLALEVVKLLVLEGLNIDVNQFDNDGLSPLHYVTFSEFYSRRPEIAKFLIAFGAKTDIKNADNIDLLRFEFDFFNSNPTVLRAILDSMCTYPPPNALFPVSSRIPEWVYVDGTVNGCGRRIENVTFRKERLRRQKVRWYETSYPRIPTLQHFSRFAIRKAMGPKRLIKVKCLPLPKIIMTYIMLGVKI